MEYQIDEMQPESFEKCAEVIRRSFQTVADELGFTEENNPSNGAFIKAQKLGAEHLRGVRMFGLTVKGQLIGFVAVEKSSNGVYYLEKLAVLPEYRHQGYGKCLLAMVKEYVKKAGGSQISIGIVHENKRLKKWYQNYGFLETTLKQFEHLPFTVSFMVLNL